MILFACMKPFGLFWGIEHCPMWVTFVFRAGSYDRFHYDKMVCRWGALRAVVMPRSTETVIIVGAHCLSQMASFFAPEYGICC